MKYTEEPITVIIKIILPFFTVVIEKAEIIAIKGNNDCKNLISPGTTVKINKRAITV